MPWRFFMTVTMHRTVPISSSSSFSSMKAYRVLCRSYCRQCTRWWKAICTASANISWESWLNGCTSRSCLKKCRISEALAIQKARVAGLSRLSWRRIKKIKKCSVQMQMYNLNDLQKKSAHMNSTCLTTLTIDFASRGKWSVETSNAVCLVLPYHVMSRVSRFLHFFVPSKLIQFKDVS